jgi:glutathione synthase/RimK-type ligase-like ATP-grasp enzyme
MSEYYHLGIAWDWELDSDFILMLESQIQSHRLFSYSISHHNVNETIRKLQKGELRFGAFLDRAGEGDEKFIPLARLVRKTPAYFINHPDLVLHAIDKATMHLEFIEKGIDVPFSVIISPYTKKKEVELRLSDIAKLQWPFIIKPANTTGGGIGVVLNAASLKDVIETRQHHKNDKYLLQEKIIPAPLNGKKGWFRIFSVFGNVIPCWWDDETHIYSVITKNDMTAFHLRPLITITKKIHEVCKLDFFSTEIAVTVEGKFVTVDYVNDICDMRLQSEHIDGVPDLAAMEICRKIAKHLKSTLRPVNAQ